MRKVIVTDFDDVFHPVDLVIHSTWPYSYPLAELREWLPEPMRNRIVDVT